MPSIDGLIHKGLPAQLKSATGFLIFNVIWSFVAAQATQNYSQGRTPSTTVDYYAYLTELWMSSRQSMDIVASVVFSESSFPGYGSDRETSELLSDGMRLDLVHLLPTIGLRPCRASRARCSASRTHYDWLAGKHAFFDPRRHRRRRMKSRLGLFRLCGLYVYHITQAGEDFIPGARRITVGLSFVIG